MQSTSIPPACPRGWSPRARPCYHQLGRRLTEVLGAACLAGVMSVSAVSAFASTPTHVQATQELVVLLTAHSAYGAPEAGSPRVSLVSAHTPITGAPTTLPVISRSIGAGAVQWLHVMLPGRPDGRTGWISQQGTSPLVTPWRIVVALAGRRVRVYDDARMVRSFQAVVGKPSTPTPTGEFFVQEVLRMAPTEPGGPFALALSAHSNALQEFEGGPGQIAIHGRDNLGGTLGTAVSHGCIRVATASIEWLAARIGAGTPVTIEPG
ncbi:MAG TPA: L,D-transpeptidase [Solirubrobacteraceae bacterium]|nr:L,D-transpeptidase [Solirubrobacteraceae bacterium]